MFGWKKGRGSKREPLPEYYEFTVEPMKMDPRNTLEGVFASDGEMVGVLSYDKRTDTYFSTAVNGAFVEHDDYVEVAQHLIQMYVLSTTPREELTYDDYHGWPSRT